MRRRHLRLALALAMVVVGIAVVGLPLRARVLAVQADAAQPVAETSRPLRILITGNSIARGVGHVPLEWTWSYQLVRALDPYGAITRFSLPLGEPSVCGFELSTDRVEVINVGRDGEETSVTRDRLEWDIETHRPDAVLVITATNDIAHGVPAAVTRRAMQDMEAIGDAAGTTMVFATVPVFDWPSPSMEPLRERHNGWLRESLVGEAADIAVVLTPEMRVDGGHFGPAGNRIIAREFLTVLKQLPQPAAAAPFMLGR